MKSVFGIDIQADATYISYSGGQRRAAGVCADEILPLEYRRDIGAFLRTHGGVLRQACTQFVAAPATRPMPVYIVAPPGFFTARVFEDTISFSCVKRINMQDIQRACRYIEDTHLSWDEQCVHQLVRTYTVDGVTTDTPPLGAWSRGLTISSLLVWTKNSLIQEADDALRQWELKLGGFIWRHIASVAGCVPSCEQAHAYVADVGHDVTCLTYIAGGTIQAWEEYNFGIGALQSALQRRFAVSEALAHDMERLYLTFTETDTLKEVSVRDNGRYSNISMHSMCIFARNVVQEALAPIFARVAQQQCSVPVIVAGRLNEKSGFSQFVQRWCSPQVPVKFCGRVSAAGGAARYAVSRSMENRKQPVFWKRWQALYQEYF